MVVRGAVITVEPQTLGSVERHFAPLQLTSLIGRDREVRVVVDLLERPGLRLLTLTGPGGTGKTRLALAASARLIREFEDGVYFVDLSSIRDHTLAPETIARAIGQHETGDRPLVESMLRHLRERSTLLVLDNFEQILDAAPTVSALLRECLRLKVLVTSRAALHLTGEHEYPVPPLTCPDIRQLPDADTMTQYEAVALFVQRAQAVRPDFQVTPANAASIAELCSRLDGLPLAIELAAARVKLLTPQALLARLENRLGLLTGGSRDRPARQQTLRDAIAWSYDLLDEPRKALFTRLSVFVGGATIAMIEGVCNVDGESSLDILDLLSSLVDESLVRRIDGATSEAHFDLLESIREYGLDRLEARGETELMRARHAERYCQMVEAAETGIKGPAQREWLDRLALEHANARAALSWAIERDEQTLALRLAAALGAFWQVRDHLTEGQDWLEQALQMGTGGPSNIRAKALNAAGALAFLRGEHARAADLQLESIDLWRQVGDDTGRAAAMHNLARAVHYQREYERAGQLYQETLALRREIDDRRGMAATLNSLGVLMRDCEDDVAALALYQESLALHRQLQDLWGQALLLNNMSRISRDGNKLEETQALSVESLALFVELGDRHGVTWVVSNLSIVAQRQQALERAARLIGATEAIRETLGAAPLSLSPGERAIYDEAIRITRETLGPAEFGRLQAAGRAMAFDEIVEFARQVAHDPMASSARPLAEVVAPADVSVSAPDSQPRPARVQVGPLTRREAEVAAQVARGLTNKQIARELVVSEGTVGVHLERIFGKLGIRSRAQLAVWVVEQKL